METTYRLSQTGKKVQELLDKIEPNQQAITDETNRSEGAESQLQDNINAEEARAKAAEQQLQQNIDAVSQGGSAAVTTERERAQGVEQILQQNINTETSNRIADVDTEEARAKAAEQTNAQAIITETTRAEAAEQTLQNNIDAEETRARGAEQTLQDNIDAEQTRAQQAEQLLDGKIAQEQQRAEGVEGDLQADIDDINAKIPVAASAQNQLADKQFVNSSIQTATADFKGTYNSKGELDQVTANANDYAFVKTTDHEGNTVYSRYKWVDGQGWMFEYTLNNSSFTAAQWAAIQSGITALLVAKLTNLPTNDVLQQLIGTKQDTLHFDTQPTLNSTNPVQSGGIFEALTHKQDALEFDQEPTQYSKNPVVSGALYNIFQAINSLFPAAASSQNKLTDKLYVDQTVATAAPDFKGVYTSVDQLNAVTGMTVNDFAFVTSTDSEGNTIYGRYHYSGSAWVLDFSFASNAFTQAQWAAINSGISALLVEKLGGLPTNTELTAALATKQDALTFDSTPTQGSQNPVTSEGIANAILAAAGVQFIDVSTLPGQVLPTASADTMGKIYLVPQGQNASDWYVTVYDANHDPVYYWKQVNTTSVDLSNYYTKQEVDAKTTRLQTQVNERNVTIQAVTAPNSSTLTYTNALGETANHIVGDHRIVPNAESSPGYDVYELLHLENNVATWGTGGGSTDIRQKLWINLNSNQTGDTSLNGIAVKVEADNETVLDTTWSGATLYCRISPLKQVTVTVGTKTGYYLASTTQSFESSVAGETTLNFNYETCVVKFQPTSNQGAGDSTIESATGTINGVAVNYGESLKVAMGQSITVACDAIANYVTPANYTGTASTAQLTPALVYQTTLVTISWESNLGTDPVIDAVQATVAGRTVSSGETIKVATGSSVAVVFPNVEGYRTPSIATFTAEGTTVVKPTVQYSTDVYTVTVDSNQSDKTDISGVKVVVSYVYAGQSISKELADGDTIKVPTGTTPAATSTDVTGYCKTITVTAATLTIGVQYDTTIVSVNATSNQSTQQIVDPVLTGLTFEINGTEVAAGVAVKVPTGSALTITSPDITHYAKTVTAAAMAEGVSYMATVAYTTTLVTLNMVSDVAGVETSAPTGARGTVSYTGGTDQTIANGEYAKVPTGTQFAVTYVAVTNYGTPTGYSGTASGTSMTATKAAYVQGVVVINLSMSDSDATALALAGATVSINSGTPIAYTGAPIPVAPLSNVVVHFTDVEGYATPADQTFIMPTGTKTVSASYDTTIFTVYITSNQNPDATIASKKVSVTYTGLSTPKEVSNNGTVKVPTGLTPTATAPDVTGYAKTVTVLSASRIITAAYQTTLVSVEMVGETSGVEGAAPTGAQATVSYQGGADQVLTDNTQTANVPTGTAFTITYATVNGYATPATYSATAAGTSMTATKAKYIYGALQLNVTMSDSDATALASVAPEIAINGGTPTAMTGSAGVFTANLNVGDTYEITFNSLVEDGYLTPAAITGTFGGSVETKTATYQTDIYTVYVTSNQTGDTAITSKKVTVSYTGLTTAKEVSNNGTVKVPAGLTPTAMADDVTNYAKTVTVLTASRLITAAYETTIVGVNMVGVNGGVEGAAPTGAGATVKYQGGTDQAIDNSTTAKVPTGTPFTIEYDAVSNYSTPATYSGTATGASMTATKATYIYGALKVEVTMSDSDDTALADVIAQIAINGGSATAMTGTVDATTHKKTFTANLDEGDTYVISFGSVEGYATPASISGTKQSGVETKTAEYQTDIYTLTVTGQSRQETIEYQQGGQAVSKTISSGNSVKVPTGTTPTVASAYVKGYARTVTIGTVTAHAATITVAYSTTATTIAILSNQTSDQTIAALQATVAWTYDGHSESETAGNGQSVSVPTGVTPTVTFPNAPTGYSREVSQDGLTATYSTTIVSVNMVGVNAGVEGAAPTGAGATVKYQGGTDQHIDNSTTAKVPTGTAFTIEYDAVANYSTPATYSATAAGTSMTATKASYVYGVLKVEVTMNDNDNTDLALITATIAVNGGSATAMQGVLDTTNHKMTFDANLETGNTYVIAFGQVEGYATPASISDTKQSGVETKTAEYQTDIYTLTVTGQIRQENIEYQQGGQTVSNTVSSGNSVKVPTGTTPTVASAYVKGYARSVTIGTVTAHAATITVAYSATATTIVILSNQTSDQTIAALQATVAWTYDGHSESETAGNGQSVNVPTGVTPTVTFPQAPTGYSRSVSGNTATYSTMILTVALTSDTGEADLSGVTKTVTDTTDSVALTAQQDGTYKVPSGHGYQVSVSDDVEGYSAPVAVTGTATATQDASTTVTMTYEEQAGFVDLGLTSGKKWAIGNIVSDGNGGYKVGEETDYGAYFSWGNIVPHFSSNGSTFDDSYNFGTSNSGPYASTPGNSVGANIPSNDAAHDAALALLGTPWHLPTKEDFQELYDETDNEWTTINGVAGRKFMKKTDHSVYVFFPAAGDGYGTSLYNRGTYGSYWSASWSSAAYAYYLSFNSSSVNPQNNNHRCNGYSVRAVQ